MLPPSRRRTHLLLATAITVPLVATLLMAARLDVPRPARVGAGACSEQAVTAGWTAGRLQLEARDLRTGRILVQHDADAADAPASTLKLLAAATALQVLGPDHRIATRVVRGEEPGSVVLVGGGDPTLTTAGSGSVYPDAPTVDDLAEQTTAAWQRDPSTAGTPITRVGFDDSLFSGPDAAPGWPADAARAGDAAPVHALMVDGGRRTADLQYSRRTTAPAHRAAALLAERLGATVGTEAHLDRPGRTLAVVRSATVARLTRFLLLESDNELAETLTRLAARREGRSADFPGAAAAVTATARRLGLPAGGFTAVDASGLSRDDRMTAHQLTALVVRLEAARGRIGGVLSDLPVGGRTGTLAQRFAGDGAAETAGRVQAKTGTLRGVSVLAGTVRAADGARIAVAIRAVGAADTGTAESAVDDVVTRIVHCGAAMTR